MIIQHHPEYGLQDLTKGHFEPEAHAIIARELEKVIKTCE